MEQAPELPKRRKFISLELKQKIILYYDYLQADPQLPVKDKSINHMTRISGFDRRLIKKHLQNREDILGVKHARGTFKKPSTSDLSLCPTIENELFEWIVAQRSKGVCVSGDAIQREAVQVYNRVHPETLPEQFVSRCDRPRSSFSASSGWLSNFCKRKKLVLRRVSTTGRELPKDVLDVIYNFFKDVCINIFTCFTLILKLLLIW